LITKSKLVLLANEMPPALLRRSAICFLLQRRHDDVFCPQGAHVVRAIAGLVAGEFVAPMPSARAAGVLTVAMTAGDLPTTTANPDQGFEGFRFVG
jgi:hypothetical protein